MKLKSSLLSGVLAVVVAGYFASVTDAAPAKGWLAWRGPNQNGSSSEKGLPDQLDVKAALWTAEFSGQSTPVIANGKLYIMGYVDNGPDLQEGVACYDAESGKLLWKHLFNDFISDTIYLRYATSSPAVDPETGNVYIQGTQGILACFTADGKLLWSHSLMEKLGRLTFPNSRTASPAIDGDYCIIRGITGNWGAQGVAGDRFYALDKKTGELVWATTPGDRPKDNSFSHPYFFFYQGKRVFVSATGDGAVICVNARTGETLWRVPIFKAGINSTTVVHNNDKVVTIFGTPYEPGQTVCMKIPAQAPVVAPGVFPNLDRAQVELWHTAEISSSTSSPILAGDRLYTVKEKGDLVAVDVNTGKILWKVTLGIEQRNACPLYADGKIYVPILDDPDVKGGGGDGAGDTGTKGALYVIKPSDTEGKILSKISLDGRCLGTPVAYNGKIYLQTTRKIYCFGKKGDNAGLPKNEVVEAWPKPGPAASLQIIPNEALLHPGDKVNFRIRSLDANGFVVQEGIDPKSVKWASYIPPTALVKATMNGAFNADGQLEAPKDAKMSAGAFEGTLGNLKGYIRGRVLPGLPFTQDFEAFMLSDTTTNTVEPPTKFAYPPLPWIGARFRFEVRDADGSKALTKTIDNKFFQRGTVFIGDADMRNYTVQSDVMSAGKPRKMSEVGQVNQRYLIILKGNAQEIEVNSNQERLKVAVPFKWKANEWMTLKSRVDIAADGSGIVRAKAWKRGEPEPAAWNIEVPHKTAHKQGSPGLFGFAPQDLPVFIDNVKVTAN
ncbi:MAG: PQQ-binding-like beta-propeller repeat protein [Verrucomicrobia bacterium]|nr:PQQ-binding-like beta-propeller repeat protein [Verrucomicrobiota bacterium]